MTVRKKLLPLFSVIFSDQISASIVFPMLTIIIFNADSSLFPSDTPLSVRSMWYGLCVSITHIFNIVSAPLLSIFSDFIGRKRILLLASIGTFIAGICAVFSLFLGMVSLLLLGRAIGGMLARVNPVALAAVVDLSDEHHKLINIGYLQFVISVSAFLGPVISTVLVKHFWFPRLNYSLPFIIAIIASLVAIIVVRYFFKETGDIQKISDGYFSNIKKLFSHGNIFYIIGVLVFSQLAWSMYYQYIAPILHAEAQFVPSQISLFIGMVAFWLAMTSICILRQLQRLFSIEIIVCCSIVILALGLLCSVFAFILHASSCWQWIFAAPIAAADVVIYSTVVTLFSNLVNTDQQGHVMGVSFLIASSIWALTGFLGSFLLTTHPVAPLAFSLAAAMVLMLFIKQVRSRLVN